MVRNRIETIVRSISAVIRGKDDVIIKAVVCLTGGGHLLIEDVPGVGKTTLAHALARVINGSFQRIQFTSDLLPSDILGTQVYDRRTDAFEFRKGPIFANIVLADEINRNNPKTQSALLEAMNERRVSQEGVTHHLPLPFMLIATQNPVEFHGTFPLPESQLDRFMMSLSMGYPAMEDEKTVLFNLSGVESAEGIAPAVTTEDLVTMRKQAAEVRADVSLVEYLLAIVRATRESPAIRLGASTRGAMFMLAAARAMAYCDGRDYLVPDDIKSLAVPVLAHRIIMRSGGGGPTAADAVGDILRRIPPPV
ncbi:MAG: MoxR family ATPase [Nitrospirae bacterium]|nr:MoxR family ATPase [Nitrospirota bacterium]